MRVPVDSERESQSVDTNVNINQNRLINISNSTLKICICICLVISISLNIILLGFLIIRNFFDNTENCSIGDDDKCLTCNGKTKECLKCNPGYFLPDDDSMKIKCQKCSLDKCSSCFGTRLLNTCTDCEYKYKLTSVNNDEICLLTCSTGYNEKCKSCNYIEGRCETCNSGYFIPKDNEFTKICSKCNLENCNICEGTKDSNSCVSCENGYFPIYDKNNKITKCKKKCEIGKGKKCLKCGEGENIDICGECNIGYFLPADDNEKLTCEKCSVTNCLTCSGNKDSNICSSCPYYLTEIYDDYGKIKECKCNTGNEEKCLTCTQDGRYCESCNIGYKLVNGECKLNHHIRATFITSSNQQLIHFISSSYLDFTKEIILDGKILDRPVASYNVESPGEHIVYFNFDFSKKKYLLLRLIIVNILQ